MIAPRTKARGGQKAALNPAAYRGWANVAQLGRLAHAHEWRQRFSELRHWPLLHPGVGRSLHLLTRMPELTE